MLSGCLLVEYGRDATIRVGVITNGVSTDQSAPTPWCRRSTSLMGGIGRIQFLCFNLLDLQSL